MELEGSKCQICGSTENVKHYCGGALAFLCGECDMVIRRWNYASAIYSKRWSGITDDDIVQMKKFAQHNQNLKKPPSIDTSMDVFESKDGDS